MARLPGKKFETWRYEKNRQEIDVPVRVNGLKFLVVIPELDIHVSDETLTALQNKVFKLLDEKLSLQWERYLYITVSGDTSILRVKPKPEDSDQWVDDDALSDQDYREANPEDDSVELSLHINVERWELTTGPTGQKLSRRIGYNSSYTDKQWPDTGEGDEHRYNRSREMRALVPDTPEAREALNVLSRDLQRLNDRLRELFAPERAAETLALAVSGVKLLASSTGDK
jgi:hypothetical protein